jgi:hypothetical protein
VHFIILLILALLSIHPALASEQAIELKQAPGLDRVEAN